MPAGGRRAAEAGAPSSGLPLPQRQRQGHCCPAKHHHYITSIIRPPTAVQVVGGAVEQTAVERLRHLVQAASRGVGCGVAVSVAEDTAGLPACHPSAGPAGPSPPPISQRPHPTPAPPPTHRAVPMMGSAGMPPAKGSPAAASFLASCALMICRGGLWQVGWGSGGMEGSSRLAAPLPPWAGTALQARAQAPRPRPAPATSRPPSLTHVVVPLGDLVQHHTQHVCSRGRGAGEGLSECSVDVGVQPGAPTHTQHAASQPPAHPSTHPPACSAARSWREIMARLYSSPAVTSSFRCMSMICRGRVCGWRCGGVEVG